MPFTFFAQGPLALLSGSFFSLMPLTLFPSLSVTLFPLCLFTLLTCWFLSLFTCRRSCLLRLRRLLPFSALLGLLRSFSPLRCCSCRLLLLFRLLLPLRRVCFRCRCGALCLGIAGLSVVASPALLLRLPQLLHRRLDLPLRIFDRLTHAAPLLLTRAMLCLFRCSPGSLRKEPALCLFSSTQLGLLLHKSPRSGVATAGHVSGRWRSLMLFTLIPRIIASLMRSALAGACCGILSCRPTSLLSLLGRLLRLLCSDHLLRLFPCSSSLRARCAE
mmetsp:Transcript_146253/g.272271  ORF Transcript_146253/g.272271 Transcript_146253/m.272271 type:complete len:274 (+) Transcript_146253:490-1311(+)